MLCCGVLTIFAAIIIGLRQWLRAMPRVMVTAGGVVLLVVPVLTLAAIGTPPRMSRADVIEQAMYSLCGRPLE